MRNCLSALLSVFVLAASWQPAFADKNEDVAAINDVLSAYEKALNASSIDEVIFLYAADAVFMPQHSAPQVGQEAVRAAYAAVFEAIDLEVSFTIDEIVPTGAGWAFARTRSQGSVTINATGEIASEGNQEIFLFQKQDDGVWKIACYIFTTTNPPQ